MYKYEPVAQNVLPDFMFVINIQGESLVAMEAGKQ